MTASARLPIDTALPPLPAPRVVEARPLWPVGIAAATRGGGVDADAIAGRETRRGGEVGCRVAQRLCDLATLATAAAFALPVGELTAKTRRTPDVALARQSAMYLAHVAFGLSYSAVGRGFCRDRTTAAHACRLIEDRRDDPAVDAVLVPLEDACGALRRRLAAPTRLEVRR